MKPKELSWLAGYLEGEGCFSIGTSIRPGRKSPQIKSPAIQVAATDLDVLERAAILMGTKVRDVSRATITRKRVWVAAVCGKKAISLMKLLLPHMGMRRRGKILEVIAIAMARPGNPTGERCGQSKLSWESVGEIRKSPLRHGQQSLLARKFGVSQTAIWCVINGKTWRDRPSANA